jgi:hypothetical protein
MSRLEGDMTVDPRRGDSLPLSIAVKVEEEVEEEEEEEDEGGAAPPTARGSGATAVSASASFPEIPNKRDIHPLLVVSMRFVPVLVTSLIAAFEAFAPCWPR